MQQQTFQKALDNNKKHVIFDSDDNDEEVQETTANFLNFSLVKIRHEQSFGFEIQGDVVKKGQHYLDSIEIGTASHRAGIKRFDKIIKLNNVRVENMKIENLLRVMEGEITKDSRRLELLIERKVNDKCQSNENDIFKIDENLNESECDSDEAEGFSSLRKRLKTFGAMEKEATKKLSEEIKQNFLNKKTKLVDKPKQAEPSQNYIEISTERTNEQIRQENIDKISFTSPLRPYKRPNIPSKVILNNKAKEFQKVLSQQGKYVLWQDIIYELLNYYQCDHIGDLGILQADQLFTISDLLRLQKRIDTFLISYETRGPCMTLLDIEQSICKDYNYYISNLDSNITNVTRFEDLYVGPLIKNQIVRQILKVPDQVRSIDQMKPIRMGQVFKHLENYLKEYDLWASKKVKQDDFEAYLVAKLKVKSIEFLGIKINSIALLIGSLKNVQHTYGNIFKEVRSKMGADLQQLLEQEKKFIHKYLNEKLTLLRQAIESNENDTLNIQELIHSNSSKEYLNQSSTSLVQEFIGLFEKILTRNEYPDVKNFLDILNENKFMRDCFQIAICIGKHDIDSCLRQISTNKSEPGLDWQETRERNEQYNNLLKKIFFLIIDMKKSSIKEIKRFLGMFLKEKNLRIVNSSYKQFEEKENNTNFIRIETDSESDSEQPKKNRPKLTEQLTNKLPEPTAQELSNYIKSKFEPYSCINLEHLINLEKELNPEQEPSFIEFIFKNQFCFQQFGITASLFSQETVNSNNSKKLIDSKRSSIAENIKQLSDALKTNFADHKERTNHIKQIIQQFYNVTNFEDLEIGDFYKASEILKNDKNKKSNIVYIDSLLEHSDLMKISSRSHSLLSDRTLLKQKLLECPLLENINDYLDLNTEDLKEIINDTEINVLETTPGTLLKITNNTDINILKESIERGDIVNSSGHLVSLIALKYRTSTPCSLIANEIESSLAENLKKTNINKFYTFIISWILKLPIKLTNRLVFKYVLGPAAKVLNNNQIKSSLFEHLVQMNLEVTQFIKIGIACSINEWSVDNYTKIKVNNSLAEVVSESSEVNSKENNFIKTNEVLVEKSFDTIEPIQTVKTLKKDDSFEYNHVVSIRERYGIGIELNAQSKSVTDSLKGVIGRSLESLSNELYNKDMHFVLELIQNADDNRYEENCNLEPTLVFLIENDCVTLFNNENGFNETNISAICDVKASTKGKHQRGYIGRKGIGFKSVFTVTDKPEIHSNNFHVNFDLKNGHIGYILPNWISNTDQINKVLSLKNFISQKLNKERVGNLNTIIRLPLKSKSEQQRHKSSLLTNNFNDIKPYLLLFLNRLQNLVIVHNTKESLTERIYHRTDLSNNLIEIRANHNKQVATQKWLVLRESLKVPLNLKPNDTVIESTDICLAFPFETLKNNSPLQKMDVFAYLPLRSFGFSFIIQADFVVPASRQDVTQDSDWNQWIVKQIPLIFVESFQLFKKHTEFETKIKALKAYLRFIPLDEEIVGFFQHIPREISELLRNEEIIPVIGSNDSEILWKKPFECVIIQGMDEFVRQVLTSDLLKKYLGRYYVHSSLLDNEVNTKVLINLGVKSLGVSDIIEILKSVFSDKQHFKEIQTTAKWLVVLQHCLSGGYSIQEEDKFVCQIKQLQFIPVIKNGSQELVSLTETKVFFSGKLTSEYNKVLNVKTTLQKNSWQEDIEQDLNIIDSSSLLCLDQLQNSQIVSILKMLGVKQAESKEVIESHIYHVLANEDELGKRDEPMVIKYLLFIHEHWRNDPHWFSFFMPKIKEVLLVKTNKGLVNLNASVYLTPRYGNKNDLANQFKSYENWCLIDSCYIDNQLDVNKEIKKARRLDKSEQMLSWRRFLLSLGLLDIFIPTKKVTHLKEDQIADSIYSDYLDHLGKISKNELFEFVDYECHVCEFYMNKAESNEAINELKNEMTSLYRLIEENWENGSHSQRNLEQFKFINVNIVVFNKESDKYIQKEISAFPNQKTTYFSNLINKKWILAESIKYTSNNQIQSIHLLRPSNAFTREQIFLRYYNNSVSYAINTPSTRSTLSKAIGFKTEFNISDFILEFQKWPINFHGSISQMKNIYILISNYLNSYETKPELKSKIIDLIQKKILFVPDEQPESFETISLGKFYQTNQIFWSDSSSLFQKYKKSYLNSPTLLEPFYFDNSPKSEKLRQIFLKDFNIPESPNLIDYINLLEHISLLASSNKSIVSVEETLQDVYSLYEVIVDKCIEMTNTINEQDYISNETDSSEIKVDETVVNELIELIKFKEIIPCFNNKWLPLVNESIESDITNYALLVDDADLAENFIDKLDMIITPSQAHEDSFADKCSISNLTRKQIFFLKDILNLNSLSQSVTLDLENVTEHLQEAPTVQNICCKILPFIQSFLFYRPDFKKTYNGLTSSDIHNRLDSLKFYTVRNLQNVYRYKHDSSKFVTVSNKTCFDTNERSSCWKYFIRSDIVNNENDIIKGFIKIFVKSSHINEASEKDLITFCLLMRQFSTFRLREEDRREIERDYKIKLHLPQSELLWKIKELNVEGHETVKDAHYENAQPLKKLKKNINNQNGSPQNNTLIYEQLSRNQINMPTNATSESIFSIKQINDMTHNVENLKQQMTSSFNVNNFTQRTELNDGEIIQYKRLNQADINQLSNSFSKADFERPDVAEYISNIGRWGEIWVNEMLKRKHSEEISKDSIIIEWVNESNETGLPYDIRITNNQNNQIDYIEVKSTTKLSQESFAISYNELNFAQNYPNNFHIYRLYNACANDPNSVELKIIKNIPSLLNSHGINLFIVI